MSACLSVETARFTRRAPGSALRWKTGDHDWSSDGAGADGGESEEPAHGDPPALSPPATPSWSGRALRVKQNLPRQPASEGVESWPIRGCTVEVRDDSLAAAEGCDARLASQALLGRESPAGVAKTLVTHGLNHLAWHGETTSGPDLGCILGATATEQAEMGIHHRIRHARKPADSFSSVCAARWCMGSALD